jgi:hypothetical protein
VFLTASDPTKNTTFYCTTLFLENPEKKFSNINRKLENFPSNCSTATVDMTVSALPFLRARNRQLVSSMRYVNSKLRCSFFVVFSKFFKVMRVAREFHGAHFDCSFFHECWMSPFLLHSTRHLSAINQFPVQ